MISNSFKTNELANNLNQGLRPPWQIEGWESIQESEGWSSGKLHASWIHLHWPSYVKILHRWKSALE